MLLIGKFDKIWASLLLLFASFAAGCLTLPADPPPPPSLPSSGVIVTVAPLPSLYPTETRPLSEVLPTQPPAERATRPPSPTPVDLNEPVLTLDLRLPAIGLDRSISGNVAGAVTLIDHATGDSVVMARSGRLLAEIRAALLETTVAQLSADGCDRCLQISYSLPADGISNSGWLRDPILSASLEFLFSNSLGPHFPADTAIGFYRSASSYNVAHTIAVLDDGTLWRWVSPDDMVLDRPVELSEADVDALLEQLNSQPLRLWEDAYTVPCPGYPLEILSLRPAGTGLKEIDVQCPELSLPTTLIPFYEEVTRLAADIIADERNLSFPDQPLPLSAVIYYLRPDGANLTLFGDGSVEATGPEGELASTTIPVELVDPLLADLTNSEVLPRGVRVLVNQEDAGNFTELLLVRGELGVYEFPWRDRVGQGLLPGVVSLEELLTDLVGPLQENSITPTQIATIGLSTPAPETVTLTPTEMIGTPTPTD